MSDTNREQQHIDRMRAIAPECMVLLRRSEDFPLQHPCQVALYGSGARHTIKGGTGSGEVNSRFFVSVEEGLENAGFAITTKKWLDSYDIILDKAKEDFVDSIRAQARAAHKLAIFESMGKVMPEPEYLLPIDGAGDTAIYVLARISGEGSDRSPDAGDFALTETEIRDILACKKKYARFMLVLNVGGPVDLTPVMDVDNILLLSQLGVVTGDALADVLLGRAAPSGHLTTTWCSAQDLADPDAGEFAEGNDTRYTEGVYVGYRRFGSTGKKPVFPFGYGLSYTEFAICVNSVEWEKKDGGRHPHAVAEIAVTNTGNAAGRQVVQLYVTAPWGVLDHPFQSLCAFGKTKELAPGETQTLQLRVDPAALASWDEKTASYILEKGDYILRIGENSQETNACGIIRMPEQVCVRKLPHIGGEAGFTDWKPQPFWAEQEQADLPVIVLDPECFDGGAQLFAGTPEAEKKRSYKSRMFAKVEEKARKLSMQSLASLCVGAYKKGPGFLSVIGNASQKIAGAAGESSSRVGKVAPLVMADGPAGLRLAKDYVPDRDGARAVGSTMPEGMEMFLPSLVKEAMKLMNRTKNVPAEEIRHQYCTAIPIGTALAQSWNTEVLRQCGEIVGAEMQEFGVQLWLAPGMNIHRNPLCGRNFEYYSEDPLLTGKMAAAITRGVQSRSGCGVTIKHFCCNNQESIRFQSNSRVSERALREIYLRGFEIAIREAEPEALMTSYNLLNGVHTSEREDLLETVLREEWDFQGLVMSDWVIAAMRDRSLPHPVAQADRSVRAGNDIFMPGSESDYKQLLKASEIPPQNGGISRARLVRSASRVILTSRLLCK